MKVSTLYKLRFRILSTAANVVTAAMLVKLARTGFDVELTIEEAQKAIEAADAATEDIEASEASE